MNELEDLFFFTGPGVQVLFQLGFIPKKEEFREMTTEEYLGYLREYPDREGEKMYVYNRGENNTIGDAVLCVTEYERNQLMSASDYIHRLIPNEPFDTDEAMLNRLARILPSIFSKGTRFEQMNQ